ncbi:phosphatidate cytidylyltransferase [Hymenobacter volaticus]|uniref:phosphatidate cytidylyltransferase n=1 Tax=Hymenobacter volaticus TaxID=2932254 RepID=UPI002468A774|nr:phosphatidate cytidylyltransferase [Hymenobacter volaticus]
MAGSILVGIIILLPVLLIAREMYAWPRINQQINPFANVGINLLGLLYVSLPMSFLSLIAYGPTSYDYRRVLALLLLVWSSDIGAYAAGKSFGKHKLAPKISPGKTWEGALGGFLLTLAMGWAMGYLLPELSITYRLVVASVVAVFGPLGDLAESMLKRSVGVKDSGRIMPGHGGLLDRFDAFLFILPVLALLQLVMR